MLIDLLGAHNAESKNTRLLTMLIDRKIVIDAGCITSELDFHEQEQIRAILLTHGHYDHNRSIPSYAFNNYSKTTNIYASEETHNILSTHLIDGVIYPKFNEKTAFTQNKPLNQVSITPNKAFPIDDYKIVPIPVNHIDGSFGFEINSADNKSIFFTGDTGQDLKTVWKQISPDLLIIDLTFPDKLEHFAINAQHLCPNLLKKELCSFHEINRYLPRIILMHLSPRYEEEIRKEINQISDELNHNIEIAIEGRRVII